MRAYLNIAADLLTGHADAAAIEWPLSYRDTLQAIATAQERGFAPASVKLLRATIRGVAREAWRAGAMSEGDWLRVQDVPAPRGSRLPAGRALDADEITQLFDYAAKGSRPLDVRNAAALALLASTGVRRAECVGVDREDYDERTGAVRIRKGKGDKERLDYVGDPGARALVDRWLAIRGDAPGPLFVSLAKGSGNRLTPGSLGAWVTAIGERAGLKRITPHDLRRTFATRLVGAGVALDLVKDLMGHESIATTQVYVRRRDEELRDAASKLNLPL